MADEESEYCADPELVDEAEAEAAAARRRVAALDGCRPLVGLLDASDAPVLLGAGSALFNLAIERENADALLRLGALPKLQALISHDVTDVAAAMAGVLMNCCASSPGCRDALDQQDLLGTLLPLSRNSFDAKDSGGSQFELLLRLIGLLNNLLLHAKSARAMRDAKGIDHVVEVLNVAFSLEVESLQEDCVSCLLRVLQEDETAGPVLVNIDVLPLLAGLLDSSNEEIQIRTCGIVTRTCAQVPSARCALHELDATAKLLPLLTSSSEEVQEAAANALQELALHAPAAVTTRRGDGVSSLVELMASTDVGVQFAALKALLNVAVGDPKTAAAVREADGLQTLVHFLGAPSRELRIAAAFTVQHCSRNEANKTLLRELSAFAALVQMLAYTASVEEHIAALSATVELLANEEEAVVVLRLLGGFKAMQPLLYAEDALRPALAAQAFALCATNAESRLAIRLVDALRPLVHLLASPDREARYSALGALMYATQAEQTNQLKCRELGAVRPLVRLVQPSSGVADTDADAQLRAAWTLSNLSCDAGSATQMREAPNGYEGLTALLRSAAPSLQRPAAACLFNASVSDAEAAAAMRDKGVLEALVEQLAFAEEDDYAEVVGWAAGTLLNCAAKPDVVPFNALPAQTLAMLLNCLDQSGPALQNVNAAGALMNLLAASEPAASELLRRSGLKALLELLGATREEVTVTRHCAGAIANVLLHDEGREALLSLGGVPLLVEAIDTDDDDTQCAASLSILNACYENERTRQALVDAGGVSLLLNCLSSDSARVRAAALGALLNAAATESCAEAIRDGVVETDDADNDADNAMPAHKMLATLLNDRDGLVCARAAGVLFNLSAFGPDNRMALLEDGTLGIVATALKELANAMAAKSQPPSEVAFRLQANLIGVLLNTALNPNCKKEVIAYGGLETLLSFLGSTDAAVQALAATAIAYLNDKAEYRPGSPQSKLRASEGAAHQTFRKKHFHATAGDVTGNGDSGDINGDDTNADRAKQSATAIDDEAEETPGARSMSQYGRLPRAKVSATQDSESKGPRLLQEQPESFTLTLTAHVVPEQVEEAYEELPTPLPSPRDE